MKGNSIHGEDKVNEVVQAWAKLEKVVTSNVEILERYAKSSSNLPSQYIKQVEETRKAQEALNKALEEAKNKQTEYTNLVKSEAQLARKTAKVKADLATATSKEAKEYHKLNEAKKAADKANREEAKSLIQSANLYDRIQAKVKGMIPVYNNLAAKQQLGIKLTAKEESQLTLLTNRLTKYRGALNEINKKYGNYTMEVGNYAKGTSNLQYSIAQISRELPNFGQSFQIGVLSLTNNIGFLLDGIKQVQAQNKILRAEGKATQSVFKTILGSFFSFQTLLFVGIGLFSAYSDEISDWTKNLFKGNKALRGTYDTLKDIQDEVVENIGRLQTLVGVVNDVTVSEEKRLKAIRELNEEFPEFNTNIIDEKDNTKALNDEVDRYIDLLVKRAKLKATEEEIGKATLEQIRLEEERVKLEQKLAKNSQIVDNARLKRLAEIEVQLKRYDTSQEERTKLILDYDSGYSLLSNTQRNYLAVLVDEIENRDKLNRLIETSVGLSEEEEGVIKGTVKYYEELISANNKLIESKKTVNDLDEVRRIQKENEQYQKQIDLILGNSENRKKESRDKLEFIELETEAYQGFRVEVEKQIATLEKLQSTQVKGTKEYKFITDTINALKESIDPFSGMGDAGLKELDKWSKDFEKQQKEIYEIQKEYSKKREQLERDLSNNLKELGLSVADAFFQAELNRLDKQARVNEERANTAMKFANGNAAAELQIREQLADKQAELEEKRIKTENKAFLVQQAFKAGEIAIDTIKTVAALKAQAALLLANPVTAPLASLALGQIPLVIATGATAGAAVLAQSIPAFKDGVRNFEGGLAVVGDGGKSEVIGTDKGFYRTPDKPTLMELPKGTDVYKSQTDFNAEIERVLNLNLNTPFVDSFMPPFPLVDLVNNDTTANNIERAMDKIMGKYFSQLSTNNIIFDENGIKKFVSKGNATTILHNNRVSGKGFSV